MFNIFCTISVKELCENRREESKVSGERILQLGGDRFSHSTYIDFLLQRLYRKGEQDVMSDINFRGKRRKITRGANACANF